MAKYNEAQKRAIQKYRAANTADISMTIPKTVKEHYKEEAEKRGLSLTKFICDCVDKEIERGL